MSRRLTCPRGHEWEWAPTGSNLAAGTHVLCPVCGAPLAEAKAGSPGQNDVPTIPLPFRPAPLQSSAGCQNAPAEGTVFPGSSPTLPDDRATLSYFPQQPSSEATGPWPKIRNYEILGELGRGGMGVVYKARQLGLDRLVALKMILAADHAATEQLARFRTEAAAVARLQHPHIVQVYEIGEQEGRPYLALEYIDGDSLARRAAGTPLPGKQAAQLVQTLALAIQAAHEHGIVHRDLKPSNILLGREGWPKVSDFGLAKCLDADSGQTRTDDILGTPSYMAPEQAAGHSAQIGPAVDVYALGAILYELLTGRPPFKGASVLETLEQVRSQEPVPPRRLLPAVPRDLDTICVKCLEKDPVRRYPSALALAEDLQRFERGEPISARPPSPWDRGLKWVKRHPAVAALAACSGLLLVLGAAGIVWQWRQTLAALADVDWARQAEIKQREQVQAALDRAEASAYFKNIALADHAWRANDVAQARQLLEECPRPLRHWEWNYLWRLCHSFALSLEGHTELVRSVAFSPDGQWLASAGDDKQVRLWETRTGRELFSLPHARPVTRLAFSPDGRRLASGGNNGKTHVWNLATRQKENRLSGLTGMAACVSFSSDGKQLAAGSRGFHLFGDDEPAGEIFVWDLPVDKAPLILRGHNGGVYGVTFLPNRRQLVSASSDRTVRLWDTQTGQLLKTFSGHAGRVNDVAVDPTGKLLASAAEDRSVRIWDLETGKEVRALRGHTSGVNGVAFAARGGQLASAGSDRTVRVWDITRGEEHRTLRGHLQAVSAVAWHPDSRLLASGSLDRTVKIWDTSVQPESRTLAGHEIAAQSVAFHPSGRWLASAGWDLKVKIMDVQTGEIPLVLSGGGLGGLAFSSDGRQLAAASEGRNITLWDWPESSQAVNDKTVSRRVELKGHNDLVYGLAFRPDGEWLASASGDKTVRLWDTRTGTLLRTLQDHTGPVSSVALTADGRLLASAGYDQTIRLWETATGQPVALGSASALDRAHDAIIHALVFRPDGQQLASASDDQTVRIWDVATGALLRTLAGHTSAVKSLAYSPDGRRLVTGAHDGTIHLWDPDRGQEALTLRGHALAVSGVALSPDGASIASASWDKQVRLWETALGKVDR